MVLQERHFKELASAFVISNYFDSDVNKLFELYIDEKHYNLITEGKFKDWLTQKGSEYLQKAKIKIKASH